MKHPLKVWKTKRVKDLLQDFFTENYVKAGADESIPAQIVNIPWEKKDNLAAEEIYKIIKPLFQKAKNTCSNPVTETDSLSLFDFSKIRSFLDIGANKLDLINKLSDKYVNIATLVGIDIIPQRAELWFPERAKYVQVNDEGDDFPIKDSSVDLVNIQFVFHHYKSESSIKKTLQNAYKALTKGGKLLLWEETFEEKLELNQLIEENLKLGIQTDFNLTKRFYGLSKEQRWEFIIANDWLINVNNPHMPWTGEYREWEDWVDLLESFGFKITRKINFGLRKNAMLKQGVWVVGEFVKV